MSATLPDNDGLLILPRLRIQNANAISSPFTHGFPAITAFIGLMWALERKLAEQQLPLIFNSVGVICHDFAEQTQPGYVQTFRLTRNPLNQRGDPPAIVEHGRMHLTLTLVFGVSGGFVELDANARHQLAECVAEQLSCMRVAGGSVLPPAEPRPGGRRQLPRLEVLSQDSEERANNFRRLRRQWLPGFALVSRDDLLASHLHTLRQHTPHASVLDAWLDLSRFNWRPAERDNHGKVIWRHDRPAGSGWLVPIPVGYAALGELHPPGSVRDARDANTPFRFVEGLYSLGQWISPHRLERPEQLLWFADSQPEAGHYRCRNTFADTPAGALSA